MSLNSITILEVMMVFGKSQEVKEQLKQARIAKMINGVVEFAWLPRRLADGRYVWLQRHYAYYVGDKRKDKYFLYGASRDSYTPYASYSLERKELIGDVVKSAEEKIALKWYDARLSLPDERIPVLAKVMVDGGESTVILTVVNCQWVRDASCSLVYDSEAHKPVRPCYIPVAWAYFDAQY